MSHDSKRKTPHAHAMRAAAVTDVVDAPAAAPVHNESARTTAEQQEGLAALAGTDAAPLRDAALDDWMAWGRELARGAGLIYAVDPIVQPDVPAVGRAGRRFVHVRVEVDDIRRLSRVAPFSWSTYQFDRRGEVLEFRQAVGASSGTPVGDVGWNGSELVAFRIYLPSVIVYHNAPSKKVERGNILEWEQPLAERLKSVPVDVQVNMQTESILYTTLLLFGATIVAAAVVFGVVIWRVARHGREADAPSTPAR